MAMPSSTCRSSVVVPSSCFWTTGSFPLAKATTRPTTLPPDALRRSVMSFWAGAPESQGERGRGDTGGDWRRDGHRVFPTSAGGVNPPGESTFRRSGREHGRAENTSGMSLGELSICRQRRSVESQQRRRGRRDRGATADVAIFPTHGNLGHSQGRNLAKFPPTDTLGRLQGSSNWPNSYEVKFGHGFDRNQAGWRRWRPPTLPNVPPVGIWPRIAVPLGWWEEGSGFRVSPIPRPTVHPVARAHPRTAPCR